MKCAHTPIAIINIATINIATSTKKQS